MKRLILSILLRASACLLLFVAAIFLICALYLSFKASFTSPALASSLTALVLIGGALLLYLVLWIINHKKKVEHKPSYNQMISNFSIKKTVQAHPGESALVAALIGITIASSSTVRKKIIHTMGLAVEELSESPNITHALAEALSGILKDINEPCDNEKKK